MSKVDNKRRAILQYVGKHGQITKKQAVELVNDYYYNAEKYVGEILSRLVDSGYLKRVKPGLFEPGHKHSSNNTALF